MRLGRIAVAKATTACEAQDGKTVKSFQCVLCLFEKSSQFDPAQLELDEISDQIFSAFNPNTTPVAEGDQVIIGQEVGGTGRWIRIATGGGGGGKIFFTPTGGIAKRVNLQCFYASCDEYVINTDTSLLTPTGDQYDVWNIWSCDIFGATFITAKNVAGNYVVDAEDYIS